MRYSDFKGKLKKKIVFNFLNVENFKHSLQN